MAGEVRTVTVKEVSGKPWHKPDSTQEWHTVVIEEHPSEPIKFIQDTSKAAPAPEVGKEYEGMTYNGEKGIKFYVSGGKFTKKESSSTPPAPRKDYQPRDDSAIQAQWAIGQAVNSCLSQGVFEEESIEQLATHYFAMIERVKNSAGSPAPTQAQMDKAVELVGIPF